MRSMKKLGVLVAVFALSAIGAANASAATFTASATGELTGSATENNVFTTNGGTVTCSKAATSGAISETAATEQHVTVNYSGCTAFGFAAVDISPATYLFTAGTTEVVKHGEEETVVPAKNVHVVNRGAEKTIPITITPTFFGASMCTVTVGEQTVGTVDYSNASGSTVKVNPTVTGIKYTSTGGSCGASGENGTYTGASVVSRVGGGTVQYDA